jgi:hypothetical protein
MKNIYYGLAILDVSLTFFNIAHHQYTIAFLTTVLALMMVINGRLSRS